MKIIINFCVFVSAILLSTNAFAVTRTVSIASDCSSASVCSNSGGGTVSTANKLCALGTQTVDTCPAGSKSVEDYTCNAVQVDCTNTCVSRCNQIKASISRPQVSDASYSISSNSLTKVMCNALRIVTGSAGKSFAAFAIIAVGIGFFSGKVSWGLMIGVAVGIAAMFGAPSIVAAISGSDTDMQCSLN